jgi:hypothetical protein
VISERAVRISLWTAVIVNVFGTIVFGAAAVGHASALIPIPIPPFYAAQLAWVIGLFAGVYAWLATHPQLSLSLLLVGGLGKLGFFALFVVYGLAGSVPWTAVASALPDLILGAVFVLYGGEVWLVAARGRGTVSRPRF